MGRASAATFVLLCLVAVVGPSGVGSAARGESPPGRITDLRVCPSQLFGQRLQVCLRDARSLPLTSSRFSCSARIVVHRRAVLDGRWIYGGRTLRDTGRLTLQPGTYRHSISWALKRNVPLPGGRWRCELRLGAVRAGVTFISAGPTGRVVNIAVCDAKRTVRVGSFRACRRNESGTPLVQPEAIVCNAVVVSPPGRRARVELVPEGEEAAAATVVSLESGMDEVAGHFPAQTVFGGPAVPPGRFACRYSVLTKAGDEVAVVEKTFRVAG